MKYSKLTTHVPKDFKTLAKRFNLAPDHFAYCILRYFAENPERLCLMSCDLADARQDDEPPPLKRGE
jgi:hypothetical protein